MLSQKKSGIIGKVLLFVTTIMWGTAYFVQKGSFDKFPVMCVLAIRFSVPAVLMVLLFARRVLSLNLKQLMYGVVTGLVVAAGYLLQTHGLDKSTSSKCAFLTAAYCILVPFMAWAFCKTRPSVYNFAAAALCVGGVGCVTLNSDFSIGFGDLLILGGSVFYALQIICFNEFNGKIDAYALVAVELLTVGVVTTAASLIFEFETLSNIRAGFKDLLPLIYLAVVCTGVAQMTQMLGQRFVPSNESALILSLEAVFGVLFGVLFGGDKLTWLMGCGFALIFVSMIVSETKLSFLKRKKEKK